jgi:hypothetical protein
MANLPNDQQAVRRRPMPGRPVPFELDDIPPARTAARHRRPRSPHWWMAVSRTMRSRRGRWVLIGLACLAVVLIGLLGAGFLNSSAPSVGSPNDALHSGAARPAGAPHPSKAAKKASARGDGSLVSDPVGVLRASMPFNPLNNLHGPGIHNVEVSASSPGRIAVLGYLVPTGMGSTYGVVKHHPHSWSVSERALGRGYLAAIFIQTDRSGAPVTCTVTVDGKATDRETASGAYGRTVCLG